MRRGARAPELQFHPLPQGPSTTRPKQGVPQKAKLNRKQTMMTQISIPTPPTSARQFAWRCWPFDALGDAESYLADYPTTSPLP